MVRFTKLCNLFLPPYIILWRNNLHKKDKKKLHNESNDFGVSYKPKFIWEG